MKQDELQNHIDFLFDRALAKCGDTEDARDLTQDTLLAALIYQKKGGVIDDMRGWLLTVMNRRFYDRLRRKYRLPTVTIGEDFDIPDDTDVFDAAFETDETEALAIPIFRRWKPMFCGFSIWWRRRFRRMWSGSQKR